MVYTGRKNFEKHFGEPTHIHGLKCLGITNGPLFKEVTSIEEAIQRISPLFPTAPTPLFGTDC